MTLSYTMRPLQLLYILVSQLLMVSSSLPERAPELVSRQVLLNTWTQNSRPIPGVQSWNYYESLFKPSPEANPLLLDHYRAIARLIQTGYCPKTENWLEMWSCGACLEPNSPIKNTTNLKRFMTDQSDAHGFFGVSHSIKRVFIVFEGMITSTQRKRIFQYRMKRLQKGVKAHRKTISRHVTYYKLIRLMQVAS